MRSPETIDRAVAVARGDALECQNWAQLSPKDRDTAELGLRRVLAAGFRILGPDEVDPVTLEKAAEVAERDAVDGSVRLDPKRHKNLSDWFAEQRASAIRALGRKA